MILNYNLNDTDVNDDSQNSIENMATYLLKVPSPRIDIVRKSVGTIQCIDLMLIVLQIRILFPMLYRLGTSGGSDTNLAQKLALFAPCICRPTDTSFMSIRHMEMLRLQRPVIQTIIERHGVIFRHMQAKISKAKVTNSTATLSTSAVSNAMTSRDSVSSSVISSPMDMEIAYLTENMPQMHHSNGHHAHVPPLNVPHASAMDIDNTYSNGASPFALYSTTNGSGRVHSPIPVVNTSTLEWGIFASLVSSRLDIFLQVSTSQNVPRRWDAFANNTTQVSSNQRNQSNSHSTSQSNSGGEGPGTDNMVTAYPSSNKNSGNGNSIGLKGSWTKMVRDCKSLKSEVGR